MTRTYNIHEAKTHFSKLIQRARLGEDIIIAKAGTPMVRLVPVEAPKKRRQPGSAKGLVTIHDNFDDPLPEDMLKAFYE